MEFPTRDIQEGRPLLSFDAFGVVSDGPEHVTEISCILQYRPEDPDSPHAFKILSADLGRILDAEATYQISLICVYQQIKKMGI